MGFKEEKLWRWSAVHSVCHLLITVGNWPQLLWATSPPSAPTLWGSSGCWLEHWYVPQSHAIRGLPWVSEWGRELQGAASELVRGRGWCLCGCSVRSGLSLGLLGSPCTRPSPSITHYVGLLTLVPPLGSMGSSGPEDQLAGHSHIRLPQADSRRLLPATLSCGFSSPRNKNHSPFPGCSAGVRNTWPAAPPLTLPTPHLQFQPLQPSERPENTSDSFGLRTFASALDSASNNRSRDVFRAVFSIKPDFRKALPRYRG